MLTASILALTTIALGPAPTNDFRPAGEIIELRLGMIDGLQDARRDQIRSRNSAEPTAVVGSVTEGRTTWADIASDRERLGGADAPELILVRAFDAVFAIDPFVQLPAGDIGLMRQLFQGASLDSERALFGRNRIDRTEELMKILESARVNWLRDNGYYSARTVRNPNAGRAPRGEARLPEPAGSFRVPADMPRTRPTEEVRHDAESSRSRAIAASLFSGDEPIRVSLPFGTAPDVIASVARRHAANERLAASE
ncbi:MAG: hypothetical protein AAGA55_04480 [Planctomycetota bacterium]